MPTGINKQKNITVHKEPCSKQNLYAMINIDAMTQASQNLKAGAFKLWIYFAKNQDKYHFELSSKDAINNFGVGSKSQYDTAVKELTDKGYLRPVAGKEHANSWEFFEIPPKEDSSDL